MHNLQNPLSKLVPVEERDNGVYVKIGQQEKERIRLDELAAALDDAGTVNYDEARIAEVYAKAEGIFERIGPAFEYYDQSIEEHLQLSVSPDSATVILLPSAVAAGCKLTEKKLRRFLEIKGVRHGIRGDQLNRLCTGRTAGERIEVAAASRPVPGEDEALEFLVSLAPDFRPLLKEDGRVDYREIRSFTPVLAQQPLARKRPAAPGIPGTTVTGDPLPAPPGKTVVLPAGRNTQVTPDGLTVVAARLGVVYRDGALLHVIELFDVKGDVDFSVGNIKYRGDVLVRGNVLPGFIIEAEGSVHIKGDVESARITARSGDVTVERGIFGKNDTFISAKRGITLSFAQEASLSSEGPITFDKFLLHCDCTCGSVETKGNRGSILGGHVRAEKSVRAGQIGAETHIKTKVTLFDREKKECDEKFFELTELEKKLTAETYSLRRQIRAKSALFRKYKDAISDQMMNEVKRQVDIFQTTTKKIQYVRRKMEELQGLIETLKLKDHDGSVSVAGKIYPGTELDLYERHFSVRNALSNAHFKINKSEVEWTGDMADGGKLGFSNLRTGSTL